MSVNLSYLVRCIYKLHALVSDRQNDSWDFSHLFCGSLEKRQAQAYKHTELIYYWLIVHMHFFIACWKDLLHTRILAQASCVDSIPLRSLISIEPRYYK